MSALWQDIRFEMRVLLKSPLTVGIAALTLSLGIGANTAVFSLIKALIIRPLPAVRQAENLVVIGSRTHTGEVITLSYPNYRDLRNMNTVFASLEASAIAPLSFSENGGPARRQWGELVSGNYFETLGVKTILGRPILPSDDAAPGASPVVVIGFELWHDVFHADPNVVGRKVLLSGYPFSIVGVAEEHFKGSIVGLSFDLFVPLSMQAQAYSFEAGPGSILEQRDTQWLVAQGRLKPGTSFAQAQASMAVLGAQLLKTYPNDQITERAALFPLWRSPFGTQSYLLPAVSMLVVVGALVLLVACANVANVLLALASRRTGEIAVRLALGAGRGRLVRQLLAGSLVVSLLGGALGLLTAVWATRLLEAPPVPMGYPISLNTGLDTPVFLFSLVLATIVGMLMGLVPALRVSRVNLLSTLRSETGFQVSRRNWTGNSILVTQIAVSLLLLLSAGLIVRTVFRFRDVNPGFESHHVLLAGLDLKAAGYDNASGAKFVNQLLADLGSTAGVTAASVAWQTPLSGPAAPSTGVAVEGYDARLDENMIFHHNFVGPGYLQSLQIPLAEGRDFGIKDDAGAQRVAIVNETFARRFWPGRNPIGHKISAAGEWQVVVGVARDSKYLSLSESPQPFVYLPYLQNYQPQVTLLVRGPGAPASFREPVQTLIQRLDPRLALLDVQTLDQQVQSSMFGFEAIAALLGAAGILALALAAVGVYGVAAQAVAQRQAEIGIRMALGAAPRDVLGLVLGRGFRLSVVGAVVGLVLALGAGHVLQRTFQGVNGIDPLTFAAIALLLGFVVLAASWFPASRAARLQPSSILRER